MGKNAGEIVPADRVRPCFNDCLDLIFRRSGSLHHDSLFIRPEAFVRFATSKRAEWHCAGRTQLGSPPLPTLLGKSLKLLLPDRSGEPAARDEKQRVFRAGDARNVEYQSSRLSELENERVGAALNRRVEPTGRVK